MILTVFFFIIEESHVFINVNICKKLNAKPEAFCYFLTDFKAFKTNALFCNNLIQRNIRKHNQCFGSGNCISFILVRGSTEHVRQIISYNKVLILVKLTLCE